LGRLRSWMANKILLSKTAFVLWKRRILCAFSGTYRDFLKRVQGNALERREGVNEPHLTALFHEMSVASLNDLNLRYTPALSSPWDPIQVAAQACRECS
jgi:hypothetical protein